MSGMDTIPTLLTAVLVCKKPGLKDNNFQVLLIQGDFFNWPPPEFAKC